MEQPQKKGLTPKQIKNAVFGTQKTKSSKNTNKLDVLPVIKPKQVFRKIQKNDMGSLLEMPYHFIQSSIKFPTPEWFENKNRVDVSVIVPFQDGVLDNFIDTWDFDNDGLKSEIIFINDNCSDEYCKKIIEIFEKKIQKNNKTIGKIFKNTKTQGWGFCCNIGAFHALGNFLVFVEPDCRLFPGSIYHLINTLKRNKASLVSGMQVNEKNDTIINAGYEWSWNKNSFFDIGYNIFKNKFLSNPFSLDNTPSEIFNLSDREFINSSFMAVRRDKFLEIGGFCNNLNSKIWSDADLCASFLEKKEKILFQPNSRIYFDNYSHKIDEKNHDQGKAYFFNKWINTARIDPFLYEKRNEPFAEIKNILIRRRAAYGDVLLAASVAPALKQKFPNCKIIFATDCPEVLEGNPFIDKICCEYSERQFDVFYNMDMAYEYRPKTNILDCYANVAGVDVNKCKLFLKTEDLHLELPDKYIIIHVSNGNWVGRNWSNIKFDQLSAKIKKQGFNLVCVGTACDYKPSFCDLDLRGKTSVNQLAEVIKNSALFVGTDSFPMHVAQTFNVPGVVFFGSILPSTRIFSKNIQPVFADGIKCLGCHHNKATPCVATNICDVGVQECINGVSVDKMYKFIEQKIKDNINK